MPEKSQGKTGLLERSCNGKFTHYRNPYCAAWDKKLNQLMACRNFEKVDNFTAKIGGHTVWIENHPYASFTPQDFGIHVRPSRSTILAAHDKLIDDLINKRSAEREKPGEKK